MVHLPIGRGPFGILEQLCAFVPRRGGGRQRLQAAAACPHMAMDMDCGLTVRQYRLPEDGL